MRFFLAVVAATVSISLSDWLFFGVIFHSDYMKTPEMWRAGPESRKIAGSLLFAAFGTAAFVVLAHSTGVQGFGPAMTLAVLVWLAAAMPQTVTNTLYLKYSARLGASHSLGWLARLLIAAAAYVLIVP